MQSKYLIAGVWIMSAVKTACSGFPFIDSIELDIVSYLGTQDAHPKAVFAQTSFIWSVLFFLGGRDWYLSFKYYSFQSSDRSLRASRARWPHQGFTYAKDHRSYSLPRCLLPRRFRLERKPKTFLEPKDRTQFKRCIHLLAYKSSSLIQIALIYN